MYSLTTEQILVLTILPIWFSFPLGLLISFIIQSNEEKTPKYTAILTASEIAHSPLYTQGLDVDDIDDIEVELALLESYQIPKSDSKSDNYRPRI